MGSEALSPASGSAAAAAPRTRNAQAQAELRARRKVHIAQLEHENRSLKEKNVVLQQEQAHLHEQLTILRNTTAATRWCQGDGRSRSESSTEQVDALVSVIAEERQKVSRLRDAIRQLLRAATRDMGEDGLSLDPLSPAAKRQKDVASSSARSQTEAVHTPFSVSSGASATTDIETPVDVALHAGNATIEQFGDCLSDWFSHRDIAFLTSAIDPSPTAQSNTDNDARQTSTGTTMRVAASKRQTPMSDADTDILNLLMAQTSSFKDQVASALARESHAKTWCPLDGAQITGKYSSAISLFPQRPQSMRIELSGPRLIRAFLSRRSSLTSQGKQRTFTAAY